MCWIVDAPGQSHDTNVNWLLSALGAQNDDKVEGLVSKWLSTDFTPVGKIFLDEVHIYRRVILADSILKPTGFISEISFYVV